MDRERAEIHLRRLIEAELRRGQPDFLLVRTVEDALVSTGPSTDVSLRICSPRPSATQRSPIPSRARDHRKRRRRRPVGSTCFHCGGA
jgi:hypothetical protein